MTRVRLFASALLASFALAVAACSTPTDVDHTIGSNDHTIGPHDHTIGPHDHTIGSGN